MWRFIIIIYLRSDIVITMAIRFHGLLNLCVASNNSQKPRIFFNFHYFAVATQTLPCRSRTTHRIDCPQKCLIGQTADRRVNTSAHNNRCIKAIFPHLQNYYFSSVDPVTQVSITCIRGREQCYEKKNTRIIYIIIVIKLRALGEI
jgi:hypothetical protein